MYVCNGDMIYGYARVSTDGRSVEARWQRFCVRGATSTEETLRRECSKNGGDPAVSWVVRRWMISGRRATVLAAMPRRSLRKVQNEWASQKMGPSSITSHKPQRLAAQWKCDGRHDKLPVILHKLQY